MEAAADTVTRLMTRFRQGDRQAAANLVELFYPQLKKLAASRMRSEGGLHTWQPTALVNELYLELVKIRALQTADSDSDEKAAFLKLAAHLMRRLLIHHARPLRKRFTREEFGEELSGVVDGPAALYEIDEMLDRLGQIDPQLRTVVDLRVFEGLTVPETAVRMGCSERTVARYWNFARNWLTSEMGSGALE
jgi:RNA polymerase sigma factor (TIGR02999 family)